MGLILKSFCYFLNSQSQFYSQTRFHCFRLLNETLLELPELFVAGVLSDVQVAGHTRRVLGSGRRTLCDQDWVCFETVFGFAN